MDFTPPRLSFPQVVRYRFLCRALTPIDLPPYAGSTWRGLLGWSLRRTACITRSPTCDGCLVAANCPFFRLFEVPKPAPDDPRGQTVSHPFVLDLDDEGTRRIPPGGTLSLGITIIGDANVLLPNLVYALSQAGETGIARNRGRFRLHQVLQERWLSSDDWEVVLDADGTGLTPIPVGPVDLPPPPERPRVDLVTPLRIKRFGRLVGPAEFEAGDFLRALCRRLDTLDRHFGEGTPGGLCPGLTDLLADMRPEPADLRWLDWTRYSSRQGTRMQLGGLVGHFALPAEITGALWPLLWLGQWVHIGKSTSFGLGTYRLNSRS